MEFVFDRSVRLARRKPTLWIVQGGEIYLFTGDSIPGVVEVTDENRCTLEPDGSWGVSDYYLELAEGAIPCLLLSSVHGRLWPEKTPESAYKRFKQQFSIKKLAIENFEGCLRRDFPKTFIRMSEGEQNPWTKAKN